MLFLTPVYDRLTRHLVINHQGYFEHMRDSWGFASRTGLATLGFFVHGILPFTFEHTGSEIVNKLNTEIQAKLSKFSIGQEPKGLTEAEIALS